MPRFFNPEIKQYPAITGADADHISKSLRMRKGESLTVCDTKGTDYLCEIIDFKPGKVFLKILSSAPTVSEPGIQVTLYQCLPKADRFEYVIQKSVELGIHRIVPVLSERCVSRPDKGAAEKKLLRWQRIADEAAGQSGRGILPQVTKLISFEQCVSELKAYDLPLLFYESGGEPLRGLVTPGFGTAAIVIGPEGGFSEREVELAVQNGAKTATLGKRILRTDTAPVAALTALLLLTGNLE
ncbi:MAG TPA: 16S rRNA (uracil(1498)-N(3))-methyltransferase [Clostridiales bacterium]|nr:16S rRNA (uracil(1498)-N(3))-methyltransferase [Clostridiales bacterium]